MALARRSWIAAVVAASIGLALFFYDDVFEEFGLEHTVSHRAASLVELLLMGPGMGLLGLALSELAVARERDVRRERERAQGQRLLALGRVAASVAHEVRNPLHNLQLIVDELRPADGGPLWERLRVNLERIDRAVDLVYELARPAARDGADEPADLAPALAEAVAATRTRWPTVAIACTVPAAMVATCREAPARIIFDNLLRNAAPAALDAGGDVRVEVRREEADWVVRIANPGRLTLPPDDPAFVSSKADGLGLGLAISRQLAANAGGALGLAQEGDAVVAVLRLPAAERP